jgi:hypothetical protein
MELLVKPQILSSCIYIYIWTYVWQRWKSSLSICCTMFHHWINAESYPVSQLCVNILPGTKVTLITDGIEFGSLRVNVLIVLKSGSLNLLEPSGPVKVCNGIALPLLAFISFDRLVWSSLSHNSVLYLIRQTVMSRKFSLIKFSTNLFEGLSRSG